MTCLQLLRRLALLLILAPATCGAWQGGDLTGTWSDDAGGRYRIRQSGNTLVWFDDRGPVVMNVFTGTINGSSIEGQWWDVPGGQLLGSGRIWLSIESSDRIVKTNSSPDYGGTVITRVGGRADAGGPGVCTPVGKWDWVDGAKAVIHADGSVTHTSGYAARWQPLGGSRFLLTWNNGAIDTLTLSADGRAMTGSNNHGRSIRVTCDGPVPTADPANGGACTPVGKWDWVDGARAVIHADGSVTHSSGYAARWQPLGGSRYLLTWNNGAIDTLTLSADGRTMTGSNNQGRALRFTCTEGAAFGGGAGYAAGLCADPRTQALMDDWLGRANPPDNRRWGWNVRYDAWGRIVGRTPNSTITGLPQGVDTRLTRCEYLWSIAAQLDSTNLGTLQAYLTQRPR